MKIYTFYYWLIAVVFLAGCSTILPISDIFKKTALYEKYKSSIKTAGLESTALGKDWTLAGEMSLQDSIKINLPYRETIYFPSEKPKAVTYRFSARRGEKLVIASKINSRLPVKLFLDLFEADHELKLIASADTNATLEYKVKHNHTFLLRLQPELLRSCQVILTVENKPSLTFPVHGKDGKAIISIFGDARGSKEKKRKHEGIDIAAKKGTPVIAGTSGIISGVRENSLGGKVVYLIDPEMGRTLYYAHLDSQIVTSGQIVKEGDIIGLLGNTGNAKNTVPHLHFGICDLSEGALDPYPFVYQHNRIMPGLMANLAHLDQLFRTKTKTSMLNSPDKQAKSIITLPEKTLCKIIGGTGEWMHVLLPDGNHGFVAGNKLENIENPFSFKEPQINAPIYDEAYLDAAILDSIKTSEKVPAFATFNSFLLTQNSKGQKGWLFLP